MAIRNKNKLCMMMDNGIAVIKTPVIPVIKNLPKRRCLGWPLAENSAPKEETKAVKPKIIWIVSKIKKRGCSDNMGCVAIMSNTLPVHNSYMSE